jgi:integrase
VRWTREVARCEREVAAFHGINGTGDGIETDRERAPTDISRSTTNERTTRRDDLRQQTLTMSKRKQSDDEGRVSAAERTREQLAFIEAHRNGNTSAAYASAWRGFETWVTQRENKRRRVSDAVDLHRPCATSIAAYITYMVEVKDAATATVAAAVSGIADRIKYVRDEDMTYDPCNSRIVRDTRAALLPRAKGATQKKEIAWAQMRAIHTAVTEVKGRTRSRDNRDCMAFMLSYFVLLRVSEAVRMKRGDITFTEEVVAGKKTRVMCVHVDRMAKNDKQRVGHNRMVAARPSSEGHCLVTQMSAYLDERQQKANAPLFEKDGGGALASGTLRISLQRWLTQTGVTNAKAYGFHSLRAGGATDASDAGVSKMNIKLLGNWKSDAVDLYIRPGIESQLAASSALGKH